MAKKNMIIFWGHDFFNNKRQKEDYQSQVNKALKKYNKKNRTCYIPVFGDFPHYLKNFTESEIYKHPIMKRCKKKYKAKHPKVRPNYFLPRIVELIKNADLAVFDLNFRKKRRISIKLPLNYNVLFELGIATGIPKNCFILCKKNPIVDRFASDFNGIEKYEYGDFRKKDFYLAIEELLKAFLVSKKI